MSDATNSTADLADACGNCPTCGAGIPFPMKVCWLCGTKLGGDLQPGKAVYQPYRETPDRRHQFTLATLLLGITLLCVCFGLLAINPGLGVLVMLVALPAFVRTARYAGRRRALGTPLRPPEKIADFLFSAGITFVTIASASIAFSVSIIICAFALCFAFVGLSNADSPALHYVLVIGIGASFMFTLFVTVLVTYNTWPRRRDD